MRDAYHAVVNTYGRAVENRNCCSSDCVAKAADLEPRRHCITFISCLSINELGCDIIARTVAMYLSDRVAGSVICTLAAVDCASFVLWLARRCAACSWCVGVPRNVGRNPSSTNDLAGLEALYTLFTLSKLAFQASFS